MKSWSILKEVVVHLFVMIIFLTPFALIYLLNSPVDIAWLFVGGVIGTFLPDLDHLIYTHFLRPNELTSQRVQNKLATRDVRGATTLLYATTSERTGLIFHTVFFHCIFVVFAFLVVTSSNSILGRGVVLAFLLSLLLDETLDYLSHKDLAHWFRNIPITLTPIRFRNYLLIQAAILLLLGYFF